MILQRATWPAVEEYLRHSSSILFPIGSTEQHGPGGMLGTDAICPERIAHELSASGERILVGPTLSIGMAQHHLAFPGSISLRPSTLIAVVRDVVQSLSRTGFRRFFFLNGHGGNVATLQAAFSEIHAERSFGGSGPSVLLKQRNWYELPAVAVIQREEFGDREGSHGTPSELSLSYYAYPDDARPVPVSPIPAPSGSFTDAEDLRRRYPDGRIGCDPTLASVEIGARLCRAAVESLRAEWAEFRKG